MRKKWLKILVIGFSIIKLTTSLKVNALEMNSTALSSNSISGYDSTGYGTFMKTNLNFKNNFDIIFTFNDSNNISGYDYIQFPFNIQYSETTTGTINGDTYSNVTDLWCTNWTQRTQTYADGSTSTYSECSLWSTQVNPTEHSQLDTFQENTPNISIAIDMIYNNGKISPCELNSVNYGTTYFICKIPDDATTMNRIRMRNQGSNYINTLIGSLGIGNYYIKWKDPIKSLITEQEETNNKIDEIQTQDIPEESKEAPNQDAFNNYENKENQIKQATSNADMSAINVAMDIPTSNWIWDTLTRILNTNPMIMSMMITFLSIGVIKLILRR